MRLREFLKNLNENAEAGGTDSGSVDTGAQSKKSGVRGKIHDHHEASIPGVKTIPDWPGHYYSMYRLGVHLAGSPHNPNEHQGPFSNEMTFTTYTDVEEEMIKHSAKEMKVKLKTLSSKKSLEPDDTQTASPIAKVKRNRYGI